MSALLASRFFSASVAAWTFIVGAGVGVGQAAAQTGSFAQPGRPTIHHHNPVRGAPPAPAEQERRERAYGPSTVYTLPGPTGPRSPFAMPPLNGGIDPVQQRRDFELRGYPQDQRPVVVVPPGSVVIVPGGSVHPGYPQR
jgi:hypothetical protein